MNNKQPIDFDKEHIWHPYTSMSNPIPAYHVQSAQGVSINLSSGEQLVDGMSSWWSVLHGYNHPVLNEALLKQSKQVSHVMFGGLTHQPAIAFCKKLVELTPSMLDKVFLSDSGSVAVEVAIKMAFQYWIAKGKPQKNKLLTVRNGYHGDTFATMAVCDPVNGMHSMFDQVLSKHYFAPAPKTKFAETWQPSDSDALQKLFSEHHENIAAFIIEPIVQGAGGMRIYHPQYLATAKALCEQYNVLFIADEIATGLGRTGKLFACQWADVSPDIMCLGKTLTGGYMTLAATLCTSEIATTISDGEAGCFMHGPTYMGNPLACAVADANLSLIMQNNWQQQVATIERYLNSNLLPLKQQPQVADVRVLGAIGVVETTHVVNMEKIQKHFVELGVWIRPFGKLIYIMPPYISETAHLAALVEAISKAIARPENFINE